MASGHKSPSGAGEARPADSTPPSLPLLAEDGSELLETLRRFEEAHRKQSLDLLRACFDDDALMESVASNGRALGADETAAVMEEALRDGVYDIRDIRYELLAPEIVLSHFQARHRLPNGGMGDQSFYRLIVGRGGMMWRIKVFQSREDALAHLERHGPGLGL